MLNPYYFIRTTITIKCSGGGIERFINICSHNDIRLYNIKSVEDGFTASIEKADFYRLKEIRRKTNTRVHIVKKTGIFVDLFKYRKRFCFAIGILIAAGMIYFCSIQIWAISFEGNKKYTNEFLLKYLETINVYTGMKKSEVSCEELEAQLKREFRDISWISVSIKGTKMIINMQESIKTPEGSSDSNQSRDILSCYDGVVDSIVTRSGTPAARVGDEVKKGDLLVSGTVSKYNDAGEIWGEFLVQADADIYMRVNMEYTDVLPKDYETRNYTGKKCVKYVITIFGKTLEIGFDFLKDSQKEITFESSPVKLTENFILPAETGKIIMTEYEKQYNTYSYEEAEEILENNFEAYEKKLLENKVQIIDKNVTIVENEDGYEMCGSILIKTPVVEYCYNQ